MTDFYLDRPNQINKSNLQKFYLTNKSKLKSDIISFSLIYAKRKDLNIFTNLCFLCTHSVLSTKLSKQQFPPLISERSICVTNNLLSNLSF